jgi:outer membrane protein OmpA-like peptidoglycan-associated protein
MTIKATTRNLFPGQIAVFALATAISIPAMAQQAQPNGNPQPDQSSPSTTTASSHAVNGPKEGFWGRVNPFAGKKWVHKQTDPINDRLSELDDVNAKNGKDIQDVDGRAQAGIRHAQGTADAATQAANAANDQAHKAGLTAQNASGHVDQLNSTVNGLDQYHQSSEVEVAFRAGQPTLSVTARKQLDDLAATLAGRQGYILELEAHSPAAGATGIQNSERLAEAVKRYLVTEHEIPVYRLHSVALGNAQNAVTGASTVTPVRTSNVHIRLMENSLAAQGTASPQDASPRTGSERP